MLGGSTGEFIDFQDYDLSSISQDVIDEYLSFPQRNHFLPVKHDRKNLYAFALNDSAMAQAKFLAWRLNRFAVTQLVDETYFYPFLEQALSLWDQDKDAGAVESCEDSSFDVGQDLLGWSHEDAPIVRLVNKTLHQAISQGVSDIHFETQGSRFLVRYRLDGGLRTIKTLDTAIQTTVISRIKVMGGLDVAENRIPQDGRLEVRFGNKNVDLRVSTMPTLSGEKAVLRILDRSKNILSLDEIGMKPEDIDLFRQMISQPFGIILVTGPTGSGKTTTLYAALSELVHDSSLNIMTVEDPVEYHLPGVNQVQVNRSAGVEFSNAVRGFLRQDPDVILVGEIRDVETASTAVQASLTGHLVLATLHTNDAPTAITRLLEMGVEPFLLSSSLLMTIGQRLVKSNCPYCSQESTVDASSMAMASSHFNINKQTKGLGCSKCYETGYSGRHGIYEMMPMSERLGGYITQRMSIDVIRKHMTETGRRSMLDHGFELVKQGKTTLNEVLRVTRS